MRVDTDVVQETIDRINAFRRSRRHRRYWSRMSEEQLIKFWEDLREGRDIITP